MANELDGRRIAILVETGFEEIEMTKPRAALEEAGAETVLVSPRRDRVRAWRRGEWGDEHPVDLRLDEARPDDFDALLLPGGVMNPDRLRMDEDAVRFVRAFFDAGKPVAAICHAPWMLVEADVVRGRTLASYPSLRTDIRNAGGAWEDREVVTDAGLVTSRRPDDIPAFITKTIEAFADGRRGREAA